MRFVSEGFVFIFSFGAITAAAAYFGGPFYAIIPFLLTLFMLYFFRDPEREIPSEKDVFVSPADGKVFLIADVKETRYLNAEMKEISIFMSPADVHVNRAPCEGTVKTVKHNKGRFMVAHRPESSMANENIETVLETAYGKILLRQVAGFLARRAVCWKKPGDKLARGERYGLIKFSSRLDIYLPVSAVLSVSNGDKVKAGETVIASIRPE
jgi:phosphatidylserine decarboxylase